MYLYLGRNPSHASRLPRPATTLEPRGERPIKRELCGWLVSQFTGTVLELAHDLGHGECPHPEHARVSSVQRPSNGEIPSDFGMSRRNSSLALWPYSQGLK